MIAVGSKAYTFTTDKMCKLWIDVEGTNPLTTPGARSGTNAGGNQCKAPAGVNPSDPTVPLLYDYAIGWVVVAVVMVCSRWA